MSTLSNYNLASDEINIPRVTGSSYLTLHYRLSIKNNVEIINTFKGNPATLELGMGHLAPFLEQRLIGLAEGGHHIFELAPEQAYGLRNPDLIQPVSRTTLQENSVVSEQYEVGDLVEFAAPSGGRFAGVLRNMDAHSGMFDFNHPLAGQEIIFEVSIIGIL